MTMGSLDRPAPRTSCLTQPIGDQEGKCCALTVALDVTHTVAPGVLKIYNALEIATDNEKNIVIHLTKSRNGNNRREPTWN